MTEALIGQIVAGVVTLGMGTLAYLGIRAGQKKAEVKVDEYHKEVNSKVSLLIETKDSETAAKEEIAGLKGEAKGAADNQAKTDVKEQDKK